MSLTRAAAFPATRAVMVIVIALSATPTIAQTIRATLTGTVIDPNGGVVQGAAVTATNIATNISPENVSPFLTFCSENLCAAARPPVVR